MLRIAGVAAALLVMASAPAWACDGQVGKVIFEDTFADDSGGWELAPPVITVKPPAMLFALDSKYTSYATQNLTFHAVDGDYCMSVVLPKPATPDNTMSSGIEFWATDYNNLMMVQLSSNGYISLVSRTAGNWQTIFGGPAGPGFKADQGAVNVVRVIAKSGKLTISVNGTQIKVIRAQVPEGILRFGIYGQFDKTPEASPPIEVKSFKVTAGE
jgi:hypothetical protein